jgi:riboflavin synthase alpha subunit
MFTGIITHTGTVTSATSDRLCIKVKPSVDAVVGCSVSIAGVCLTVAEVDSTGMWFDLLESTKQQTRLTDLEIGDRVNIEPSLRLGEEVGGHFVYGHVDGCGTVNAVRSIGHDKEVVVTLSAELVVYMAPQGSVAIDGVSLTVTQIQGNDITVFLVPHTWQHTTLGSLKSGALVHIEADMLAKYVKHLCQKE